MFVHVQGGFFFVFQPTCSINSVQSKSIPPHTANTKACYKTGVAPPQLVFALNHRDQEVKAKAEQRSSPRRRSSGQMKCAFITVTAP